MRLSVQHFVLLSVLAHAAVLFAWTQTSSQTILIAQSTSSAPRLEVALRDTQKPDAMVVHKTTTAHQHTAAAAVHRHALPAPATTPASTVAETPPAPVTHSEPVAYQAEFRRNEVRNRVLSRLRTDLHQYFVYPMLAQRQGWQGRVLLGFSVEANGAIRNIHVAAGSGYPILDTSAMNALARVRHLYEASEWLQGNRLEMQMPVEFRLQGG